MTDTVNRKELIKTMLQQYINDDHTAAAETMHQVFVDTQRAKMNQTSTDVSDADDDLDNTDTEE